MTHNLLGRLETDMGIVCDGYKHNLCTAQAVYIVQVHLVDHCNKPKLSCNGDRTFLHCNACLKLVTETIKNLVDLVVASNTPRCATCSRPVNNIHDVLDVELLMEIAR